MKTGFLRGSTVLKAIIVPIYGTRCVQTGRSRYDSIAECDIQPPYLTGLSLWKHNSRQCEKYLNLTLYSTAAIVSVISNNVNNFVLNYIATIIRTSTRNL